MSRTARILVAELIGTMILILGGPGTIIFGKFIGVNSVGTLGVAIAFGLSLLCAAYLFGHISGCHINPAVTIGMWVLKRTPSRELPAYFVGQILGALIGGALIWAIVETGDNGGRRQARPQGAVQRSVERLRLALAGQVRARRRDHRRGALHRALRARDRRHHAYVHGPRLRRDPDRPDAHARAPDQHPDRQHVGEPGAQPLDRRLRRQLGSRTDLGVHRVPDRRRSDRGRDLDLREPTQTTAEDAETPQPDRPRAPRHSGKVGATSRPETRAIASTSACGTRRTACSKHSPCASTTCTTDCGPRRSGASCSSSRGWTRQERTARSAGS